MLSQIKAEDLKHSQKPFYDKRTGLVSEVFDLDHDGVPDFAFLSQVYSVQKTGVNGEVSLMKVQYPTFYLVGPGPEFIYIDTKGVGDCQDVLLYEDLTKPHDQGAEWAEATVTGRGRVL